MLFIGDPAGIRTPDTLLKRQVLCRLSYWIKNMGWVKGLEPSTLGTTIRCSNQLSYTHHIHVMTAIAVFVVRAEWQGRLDSNQRMSASKADALPLGDAPVFAVRKRR